jgi:hypothetical protein
MRKRHPPPDEPWCLIGKVSWGVVQCIKVPESNAHRYMRYGWRVLIRDTDFPQIPDTPEMDMSLLSGTSRRMWLNEEDVRRELDDDGAG